MLEIIPPTGRLSGKVILPGSKSITNRALLLAALADGVSEIRGALKSDDTKYMAAGLRQLGIEIEEKKDGTTFVVHGKNGKLAESKEKIFLGNAGTATRFLTAAAILMNGETIIDGDAHMRERPIRDLVDALIQLGAKIEYLGKAGCPPLRIISSGKIPGGKIKIRADISSQFLSAILMIAPLAEKKLEIEIIAEKRGAFGQLQSAGYISLTQIIQNEFGVDYEILPDPYLPTTGFLVEPKKYCAKNFVVEPDASSATYFWAAEKLLGGKLDFGNIPSVDLWFQPDAEAKKIIENNFEGKYNSVDGNLMPDAIPTLAVFAAFSGKQVDFVRVENLRKKECDRVEAIVKNLNKIQPGLAWDNKDSNEFFVYGDANLATNGKPATIETFDDHRIAMSFFLAGLKIVGIKIDKPDCVTKSFPNFWKIWERLGIQYKK
ncbi:MAG: 3-phosphoshikimate 1-carboxyvinyltransferase [Patescibacteria group bacterium]